MKVGVLALQGAFREHVNVLQQLNVETLEIRTEEQLAVVDSLIIPGGESTTIAKLATDFNLIEPLRTFCSTKPTWGTCAGLIFLSKNVGTKQITLSLLDVTVKRNAFGNQLNSFIQELQLPFLTNPQKSFSAAFIRAPLIEAVGAEVEILAKIADDRIVTARQNNILVTSFHPELTGDSRFHEYFLSF